MIILEQSNCIIFETLKDKFLSGKQTGIEMKCADFDNCSFHVFSTQGKKNEINISLSTKAWPELSKYGAADKLKATYGKFVCEVESGYDFTIRVDLNALPATDAEKEALARSISFMKRHAYAAPFDFVFNAVEAGNVPKEMLDLPYRGAERVWIKGEGKDRVTVVFAIQFKDADDVIIGKVFLQEFKKSIGGAPSVDFTTKDPPGELKNVKNLGRDDGFSYVTFVLFDRHFKKEVRDKNIDMLIQFRNYLHYHIKCSKSHLHTRMRNRVDSLLKVLNRAKQELSTNKTTSSGRTFKKAGK